MSGTVIIRLQNLPLEARSIDIRKFFDGLIIPDGGVHIIGGERGDAFIAFSSDEDARQAMMRDGYVLCQSQIKLYLSSKNEMQNVIAAARNQQPMITSVPAHTNSINDSINPLLKSSASQNLLSTNTKSTNPMDILSSLTKIISTPQNSQSSHSTPSFSTNMTNSILPNSSSSKLTKNDQIAAVQTTSAATVVPAKQSNISIDQIFDLLKHIKTDNTIISSLTDKLPSLLGNTNVKTESSNNSNNLNSNSNDNSDSNENYYNSNTESNNYNNRFNNNSNNSNNKYNNNTNNNFNNKNNKFLPNKRKFEDNNSNNDHQNNQDNGNNNNERKMFKPQFGNYQESHQKQMLDPIIIVKNFNNNCSYKDIRTFLQGIQIEHDGIRLLTDANEQRNGTAFVKLMTIIDLKKALCRNGQFYQENQIEVIQSNETDFQNPNFIVQTNKPNRFSKNDQQNRQFNNGGNNNNNKFQQQQGFDQQGNPIDTSQGYFIKIYGLPAEFDETELKSMFNNVKFLRIITSIPQPIQSTTQANDGTTEVTTVIKAKKLCQVETQLDLERALTRVGERVGKSKIQIFQISKNDVDRELAYINAKTYQANMNNKSKSPQQETQDEDSKLDDTPMEEEISDDVYIYMSGVPFSAREQDVIAFFQPTVSLMEKQIHLLLDPQTLKPTGECCIQMLNKQDRDRSLEKDDQLFRNRVVKVKSQTYAEYKKATLNHLENKQKANAKRKLFSNNFNNNGQSDRNNENNLEDNNEINDDLEEKNSNGNNNLFNKNFNNNQQQTRNNLFNKYRNNETINNNNGNNNNSNSYSRFQNNNNNNGNNKFNNNNNNNSNNNGNNNNTNNGFFKRNTNSFSNSSVNNSNNSNNNNNNNFKRFKPFNENPKKNFNNYNSNDNNDNTPTLVDLPPLPPELQKFRNSLVLLSNVSQKASREDILDIFKIFSPLEHTLKIRHDESGQPTGDAIVACKTPEEANKACRSLNGLEFMGRNIKAALVNP